MIVQRERATPLTERGIRFKECEVDPLVIVDRQSSERPVQLFRQATPLINKLTSSRNNTADPPLFTGLEATGGRSVLWYICNKINKPIAVYTPVRSVCVCCRLLCHLCPWVWLVNTPAMIAHTLHYSIYPSPGDILRI